MATQSHTRRTWVPTCEPRRSRLAIEARATITCRVCQAREDVPLDNEVLLCGGCRSDPYGALARLKAQTDAAEAQLDAAGARFQASLEAAHPRDQERYIHVVATMADALRLRPDTPTLEWVLRALARASSADDGLAVLLAAEAQVREMVQWVQTIYKQVLKEAGLPEHTRFHDLRHSCATLLIVMGVHPRVVMEILGHSQISTTMNIYAHVLPRVQREAITGLDALFGETKLRDGEVAGQAEE